MRISDWSSDVCSSDLPLAHLQPAVARDHRLEDAAQAPGGGAVAAAHLQHVAEPGCGDDAGRGPAPLQQRVGADRGAVHHRGDRGDPVDPRSEEHTSELQSLMRISYAVFCLKKKTKKKNSKSHTLIRSI